MGYDTIQFTFWKDHSGSSKETRLQGAGEHIYKPVKRLLESRARVELALKDRGEQISKMFKKVSQQDKVVDWYLLIATKRRN